jgi:Family of unknown function (DUF6056)
MPTGRTWPRLIGLVAIGSLLAPLAAWGYISCFTRYWYDDFCYASTTHKLGFIGTQVYWYRHWTGRFTLLFLNTVLEYLGPRTASFVTLVLLISWLATTAWAIYQAFLLLRLPAALMGSILLAELVVYGSLNSTPDIVTSFYWQTGALVYTAPLVLLMVYIGLILFVLRRQPQGRTALLWAIAGGLLSFIAGGASEVYGAVQVVALSLMILLSLKYASGATRRLLLLMCTAGLLGSVLSLAIVAIAPGNDVRRAFFPPRPHLISAVKSSFLYSLSFIERHTRRSLGTALLSVLFPLWLASALHFVKPNALDLVRLSIAQRRKLLQLVMLAPVMAFVLLTVSMVPGFYALSEAPPGRALFFSKFILVAATVFWLFFAGLALIEPVKLSAGISNALLVSLTLAVLALAVVSPLASARHTFGLSYKARTSATAWDAVDQQIRLSQSQGAKEIVIPLINANEWQLGFGRSDLLPGPNANSAVNRCLENYYGIEKITAR